MPKRYISDIVTEDVIKNWKVGEKYLIEAQTGSGKSEMIKSGLHNYAKKNGDKILLLSNRTILKRQNQADLGKEKLEIIDVDNYQHIEKQVYINRKTLESFYAPYKYIVFDESHFFNCDSLFSRFSDTLLSTVINVPKDKILILISATPQVLKRYNNFKKENVYTIPSDYNYISNIYFYNKKNSPELILRNLPDEERAIFFGHCENAYTMSQKFDDASFICSKSNQKYYKASMESTIDEIVNESNFKKSARFLFTSSVLDNGVNLKDRTIKTIIIEELHTITLLQELGRKRILDENDRINLYIRNQDNSQIARELREINKKIQSILDMQNLSQEDFIKKYRKIDYSDVIDLDLKINIAKAQMLFYLKEECEKMLQHPDGYKLRIYELLGIPHKGFTKIKNPTTKLEEERLIINNADVENEKLDLIELMEKYENTEMSKEQQEEFKNQFFNSLLKKRDFKHRGMLSINSILEEDSLQFKISSIRKRVGKLQKETFWKIDYIG